MNLHDHPERSIGTAWMICLRNSGDIVTVLFLSLERRSGVSYRIFYVHGFHVSGLTGGFH